MRDTLGLGKEVVVWVVIVGVLGSFGLGSGGNPEVGELGVLVNLQFD